ncbi:tRNA uridine-5-carboxymethylaminomethyl(34) synthesis GTPase MnmE, partial [Pseudomonadota bacterium]
ILFDTAGIRETKNPIEKEGVNRALQKAKDADLKIVIFEPGNLHKFGEIAHLVDEKTIIVVNKNDLLKNKKELDKFKRGFEQKGHIVLEISLKNNKGMKEFIKILTEEARKIAKPSGSVMITRERHRKLLEEAHNSLKTFSLNKDIELVAEDLRVVANVIGKITGRINVENILDSIFSKFCLGK